MAKKGSAEEFREMSQDGVDILSPATMPSGGWGIRGWLSALFTTFIAAIDATNEAVKTVDYTHAEIHEGNSFSAHLDNTTANQDVHRTFIGFECPNTAKWFHLVMSVATSNAAEAFFVEDVTIDLDEGIEIDVYDRNRNTANTSMVIPLTAAGTPGKISCYDETALAGATFSYATELDHVQLVAGSGPKAIGGDERGDQEWVLKQGIRYGLFIRNIGASVNLHELHFDFYEHENH